MSFSDLSLSAKAHWSKGYAEHPLAMHFSLIVLQLFHNLSEQLILLGHYPVMKQPLAILAVVQWQFTVSAEDHDKMAARISSSIVRPTADRRQLCKSTFIQLCFAAVADL